MLRLHKITTLLFTGAALAGLSGCLFSGNDGKKVALKDPFVFALTSDYTAAGSYSAVTLGGTALETDIAAIHSDAAVRFLGGDEIYVINRLGRDNIQVLSRDSLKTVLQIPLPGASNPYDVALKDGLLYVGYLAHAKIGVYLQSTGKLKEEIDIQAFADTVDGLPETTALAIAGNFLYVLAANLDAKAFSPLQARLIRIDLTSKETKAVDLPYGNPTSLTPDAAGGKFFIPCRGNFFDANFNLSLDGGIVSVDLAKFAVAETLATEKSLGGSLNSAVFHGGKLYMNLTVPDAAATTKASSHLIELPARKGAKAKLLTQSPDYNFVALDVDAETGILYLGDRISGLRLFDLATGKESDSTKVDLGKLPVTDLAIVR